ncbi:hypothetical protein Hanom_Chr03g00251761 [Helianthus anomalus]
MWQMMCHSATLPHPLPPHLHLSSLSYLKHTHTDPLIVSIQCVFNLKKSDFCLFVSGSPFVSGKSLPPLGLRRSAVNKILSYVSLTKSKPFVAITVSLPSSGDNEQMPEKYFATVEMKSLVASDIRAGVRGFVIAN